MCRYKCIYGGADDRVVVSIPVGALSEVAITNDNKIDSALREKMSAASPDEKIPVAVWLTDIDDEVFETAYTEELQKFISKDIIATDINTAKALFNNDADMEMDGVPLKEMQQILSIKRSAYSDLTTDRNNRWKNDICTENRKTTEFIYSSKYAPIVIMRVTKSELNQLVLSDEVEYIYQWEENVTVDNNANDVTEVSSVTEATDYGVW